MKELIITVSVKGDGLDPQAVKEALSYDCEKYGDVTRVDVRVANH